MNTMTREKIYLTPNQEKVIKDKYLRGDKSVEDMFFRVAHSIALSEILFTDKVNDILDGVSHQIINYNYNGTPSRLLLLHKNINEYSKREENFQKFMKNLKKIYENDSQLKEMVDKWTEEFYNLMARFEFLPNSPTLMNAGKELGQLSACYVIPVEDSMEGISKALSAQSLIQKSGGGTGFSFGRLRPKGDIVKKTSGVASGAISFMQLFDKMTDVVKQGGTRRGANMGILPYWHPEIEDFITLKSKPGVMENFNISVAIDDKFMRAVENNEDIELINPRSKEVVSKLNARKLFNKLVESAWATGDPGIIFIDRINNTNSNPTPHLGEIEATNPCVSKDTWIMTPSGPLQVKDVIGKQIMIGLNGKFYETTNEGFWCTGEKDVFKITTEKGYEIKLTKDHPVMSVEKLTRYKLEQKWKKVKELKTGDMIILSNNREIYWQGDGKLEEGYLLGLLIGDETLKDEEGVISVWGDNKGSISQIYHALNSANTLPHRKDFKGFTCVLERKEYRLKMASIRDLAEKYGIVKENKVITQEIEKTSYEFYQGFIRGIFDADGTVCGNLKKGISIRLWQKDLNNLKIIQRMLLRMGIVSQIYTNRKKEDTKLMPDGKNGYKYYHCGKGHELVISNDNVLIFSKKIGFWNEEKQEKLDNFIKSYSRKPNRERFIDKIKSIEYVGKEDVYDVSIPLVNAFDANGFYVHNCGEQPLLGWEACNLGSINLSKFVDGELMKGKINWEKLERVVKTSVRFLDNVIEVNNYPLPEIEEIAKGNRKIGLGIMGWAETCVKLGIRYDSEEGVKKAKEIMKFISEKAFEASEELAKERGCFYNWKGSIYDKESKYFRGRFAYLRNASRTTIAPTGTISIAAGLQGSGIEPFFAIAYTRYTAKALEAIKNGKTPDPKDSFFEINPYFKQIAEDHNYFGMTKEELWKKIEENHKAVRGIKEIPQKIQDIFPTAHDVSYEYHIKMQAAFQEYIDNAVSKTINMPNSAKVDDVRDSYLLAYKLGCKGITVYRDGCKDFQVLNTTTKQDKIKKKKNITFGVASEYYQIQTGYGPLHIHINYTEDGGPFQIFTNLPPLGTEISGLTALVGILLSKYLENGGDPVRILKHLNSIKGDKPYGFGENRVNSIPHAIAIALKNHLKKRNMLGENGDNSNLQLWQASKVQYCPKCYSSNISFESGCSGPTCHDCGYSECS
jgi:ribonucleoside-diphosphate reductase alpha chain